MFIRFDVIHERDRQTVRQTERQTNTHLLQCLLFELTPLFFLPHLHVVVAVILLQVTD